MFSSRSAFSSSRASSANHAGHFLSRVDRLNTPQAELALGLYRDHGLVAFVLRLAELPPNAERVAIALSEGDHGPWVIVTRDGKFVTCLGEGMKLHDDQALISRHTLDRLANKVQGLREVLDGSARGERKHCDQLLQRVLQAGHGLTQSEFDDLAKWSPVLGPIYVQGLLQTQEAVDLVYERIRREKRLGKRADPLLRAYWMNLWAEAHLTSLVFDQPEHVQRWFDVVDARDEEPEVARWLCVLPLWQTGLLPWALRGAWLAAQMPKVFLKPLKQGYSETQRDWELFAFGTGLAAIGHRHQRYRAEISKFLQRDEASAASELEAFLAALGRLLAHGYERDVRSGLLAIPEAEAALCVRAIADEGAPNARTKEYIEALPSVTKLAMMLTLPLPTSTERDGFARALMYVPAVAQLKARDFYLPAQANRVLISHGYTPATAEMCVRARLKHDPKYKPTPSRAPTSPGRNEVCPCGSGRKYKRCCASAARAG